MLVWMMSVVVSFRVSRELKKKMDVFHDVNWSEELRSFVERRVRELEQLKMIEKLEETIKGMPTTSRGTGSRYVREDRDSY